MSFEGITTLFGDAYTLSILAALMAYWVSMRMYPAIIYLSQEKNLMDVPGERSAHANRVPTHGGAGIFIAFSILSMSFCALMHCPADSLRQLLTLMAAISVLFFLGIKDDMVGLDPAKKLGGQFLSAALVIVAGGVRIENLEGIFGVGELPYLVSVLLTTFVFLLVVNAYNLIDGIDGLAGSIALIASLAFGGFFLVNGHAASAVHSFVLAGALLGFLRFNLSRSRRLFMGDSGSLFIGFLLAYQAIVFLNANRVGDAGSILSNGPVLVLSLLALPLIDTLRVFIIRIRQGRSPFAADRNHIHHRLLALGLDHKQASALLSLKTLVIVAASWLLQDFSINAHLGLMAVLAPALFLGPITIKAWQKKEAEAPAMPEYVPESEPVSEMRDEPIQEANTQPKTPESHALVCSSNLAEKRIESLRKAAAVAD